MYCIQFSGSDTAIPIKVLKLYNIIIVYIFDYQTLDKIFCRSYQPAIKMKFELHAYTHHKGLIREKGLDMENPHKHTNKLRAFRSAVRGGRRR